MDRADPEDAQSYLFVKPDGPFKDIQDLLKSAKENPGKMKVAGHGFGTIDDITVRYLACKGYEMTLVPNPKPGERYACLWAAITRCSTSRRAT